MNMKTQLTTRFDRPAVQERSKKLVSGNLTPSNIERASMNIGLDKLECLKMDYPAKFEQYVLDNQEVVK
jgi:hypothetical protein